MLKRNKLGKGQLMRVMYYMYAFMYNIYQFGFASESMYSRLDRNRAR